MRSDSSYASIFVDFENIYYFLLNCLPDSVEADDVAIQLIRDVRLAMEDKFGMPCIVQYAYADFERIESTQGALYLLGVETRHVMGTEHKNAADMRLCIDAMETMYTRSEIDTFVLLAGDRDYIPVIQHLRKHAKTVHIVAFKDKVSGDLLQIVGDEAFTDATELLPEDIQRIMPETLAQRREAENPLLRLQDDMDAAQQFQAALSESRSQDIFGPVTKIDDDDERSALDLLLRKYGQHHEIFLNPYLRLLRNEMTHLAEYERRAILNGLTYSGAIVIERREGNPNDYSVILINWDHPDVHDLTPEFS